MPAIRIEELKGMFTASVIVSALKALPPIHTSIMDTCFPGRPQHPFALLGIEEIRDVAGTVPVIRRGGMSTPIAGPGVSGALIEPLEVKPSLDVTGHDLNNLRLILGERASRDVWVQGLVDRLRRSCRLSTEGMAAQMLTGKISWPVRLDGGGWERYEVDFGTPLTATAPVLWDNSAAKLKDVVALLDDMETSIQEAGYGAVVSFMAGKKAWQTLWGLVENVSSTAKIQVEIKGDTITIAGHSIQKMAERYKNPETGTMTAKVADHRILAVATDVDGKVIYCALDDLDANLQPLPFFAKPVPMAEGNGFRVIGVSKPMPARPVKSVCWADVCAA